MDIEEVLLRYHRQMRIEIEYPDMQKEVLPHIVRFTRPAPGRSIVLYSELDESNVDRVIRQQIEDFQRKDLPFDWKVFDSDEPADLKQRLQDFGFESDLEEGDTGAIMVKELAPATGGPRQTSVADIRRIQEPQQLRDVIEIMEAVWGGDFSWISARLGGHMNVPGYLSVFVAYIGREPASAGWIYYPENSQFASLWAGSTKPQFRGSGLYTALLEARTREAMRRGRRFLIVEANPNSRPIVEKHGFRLLTHAESFALASQES